MPSNHPLISADSNSRGALWELRLGFPTLARFYCEYPNRNFVSFNQSEYHGQQKNFDSTQHKRDLPDHLSGAGDCAIMVGIVRHQLEG